MKGNDMKILYVTTIGGTMVFFKEFIKRLIAVGHTVDIATNETGSPVADCYREWGCRVFPISTSRSPLSMGNVKAVGQIKRLVMTEKYDLVHCHTPIAAFCTRLACRKARKKLGTKVFYTAHGFHFYEGAPKKNWLIFYTAEKLVARYTDVLITINREDYALAQKKLRAKRVAYVPGVGIDLSKFGKAEINVTEKRTSLGVPEGATLLLSVGELNENKNHSTVIRTLKDFKNVHYVIAGKGHLEGELLALAPAEGVGDRVHLLGYRTDVAELYAAADAFVFPSYREGLSVSLMEAMATGLPVACSAIRGNVDLIDEQGGALFDPHSVDACREAIATVISGNTAERGAYNREKIKAFDIWNVIEMMRELYRA